MKQSRRLSSDSSSEDSEEISSAKAEVVESSPIRVQVCTSTPHGRRVYDKKNACLYCG